MKLLSHSGALLDNPWTWFAEESPPPSWRKAAYPLVYWADAVDTLPHLPHLASRVGVWLKTEDTIEQFVGALGDVNRLGVIAIHIPKFTDGRANSMALWLKRRYGFVGELRAVGDVLADQLLPLSRCGFDTFALREDHCDAQAIEVAKKALGAFSKHYQANVVHHATAVSFA